LREAFDKLTGRLSGTLNALSVLISEFLVMYRFMTMSHFPDTETCKFQENCGVFILTPHIVQLFSVLGIKRHYLQHQSVIVCVPS
jgi:hypothetical protein